MDSKSAAPDGKIDDPGRFTFSSRMPLALVTVSVLASTMWVLYGAIRGFYYQGAFLNAIAYSTDEHISAEGYARLLGRPTADLLVGIHAFFDFLNPYYWGSLGNPWLENATNFPVNYPPLAMLFMKFWATFPYRVALTWYLGMMAVALALPAWLPLRKRRWSTQVVAIAVILVSGPAIASLDRGNTQGFLPLLLFAFGWAVLRGRWGWAAAAVVIATSMKLFPAVLILVLIAERRWKAVLGSLIGIGVINTAGFLLFPGSAVDSFTFWFARASEFLGRDFNGFLEYNVSFAGGVAHWLILTGAPGWAASLTAHAMWVIAPIVIVAVPLIWQRTLLPIAVRLIVAMMLTTVVLPVAYPYSLNWAIAAAGVAFLASAHVSDWPRAWSHISAVQEVAVTLGIGLLLGFYPVFIPGTMEAGYRAGMVSLVTPLVTLGMIATFWYVAVQNRRGASVTA